jgi:hypothetical protein
MGGETRIRILTALLFFCLLAILLIELDAPWQRIHEDNGAFFTAVASAHLLEGWSRTKGQDFLVVRGTGELQPYLHHPPLLGNILAVSFRLARSSEPRVARLTVIAFHLTSFLLLAAVAARVFGHDHAARLWTMFVAAVAPVSWYFGRVVVHETVGLTFLLAFALTTLRFLDSPTRGRLLAACGSLVLAGLTSWPSYFVILGLVFWVFVEVRKRGHGLWGPPVLAATLGATLALVCLHLLMAGGGSLPGQERSVAAWLGAGGDGGFLNGYLHSLGTVLDFNRNYYGNVPALLAFGWGLHRVTLLARRRFPPVTEERFVAALGIGQILYMLIFIKAACVHAYHQLNLLPFEALASGIMLSAATRRVQERGWPFARAILPLSMSVMAVSSLVLLNYRYGKISGYAVNASEHLAKQYEIWSPETDAE